MHKEAREKLVEKNIKWHEEYTDKTQFLKDQFADVVGPGSYFRFEGEAPNGEGYYCIIGPAKVHHPKAKFFAGVRKLPATFSAGGKYFDSLDTAAKYAKETWGVPTPQSLKPYTSRQLVGISGKVTDWKKKREENDDKEKKSDKEDIESFTIDVLVKEAMGGVAKTLRTGYVWQTYEAIASGECEDFDVLAAQNPAFKGVLNEIGDEKRKRYSIYSRKYGMAPEEIRDIFRVYVGYSSNHGMYAFYVGPYMMIPEEQEELYKALTAMGKFDGTVGSDIPYETVKEILNGPNKTINVRGKKHTLKDLMKRYQTDRAGWFKSYPRHYPIPSEFRAEDEMEEMVKLHGLEQFSGYNQPNGVQQAVSVRDTGKPLTQPMGLDDYSYMFSYSSHVTPPTTNRQNWFESKPLGPHGMKMGTHMPSDDLTDPMCQIYTLKNYQNAQHKNMVLSSSGTRVFLNVDGAKKLICNIIANYPEFNDELLSYLKPTPKMPAGQNEVEVDGEMRTKGMKRLERGLGDDIARISTKSMGNFLHMFAGIGNMSNEDQQEMLNANRSAAFHNGSLNANDTNPARSKNGNKMYQSVVAQIHAFYRKKLKDGLVPALASIEGQRVEYNGEGATIEKCTTKGNHATVNLATDNGNKVRGIDIEEFPEFNQFVPTVIKYQGLERLLGVTKSGGLKKPKVTQRNERLAISAEEKNKWQLIAEVADFMGENNMDEVNDTNVDAIVNFLNSGGSKKWARTENAVKVRRSRAIFNKINVKQLMLSVIKEGLSSKTESPQATYILVAKKAVQMSAMYNNEHSGNVNANIASKHREYLMQQYPELEEVAIEEYLDGMVNLEWDEKNQQFTSYDIATNFYDIFDEVRKQTEHMSYHTMEMHEKRRNIDPGTQSYLTPVDEDGEAIVVRTDMVFQKPPVKNFSSKELETRFRARPEEEQVKYRMTRGDKEMYEIFTTTFGEEQMVEINKADFDAMFANGEINQAMLEQKEEDLDIDDGEPLAEGDADVNIPPEADDAVPNEEVVAEPPVVHEVDPAIREQFQNMVADPFADDDDDDLFGDDDDDDVNASTDAIESLLKLSKELDEEGKTDESIELLVLAKKFSRNIKKG